MTSFYCLKAYKEEGSNFLQFSVYVLCEKTPSVRHMLYMCIGFKYCIFIFHICDYFFIAVAFIYQCNTLYAFKMHTRNHM